MHWSKNEQHPSPNPNPNPNPTKPQPPQPQPPLPHTPQPLPPQHPNTSTPRHPYTPVLNSSKPQHHNIPTPQHPNTPTPRHLHTSTPDYVKCKGCKATNFNDSTWLYGSASSVQIVDEIYHIHGLSLVAVVVVYFVLPPLKVPTPQTTVLPEPLQQNHEPHTIRNLLFF